MKDKTLKWFIDGDQMVFVWDDFINLQESPAVFVPRNNEKCKPIESDGLHKADIGFLIFVQRELDRQTNSKPAQHPR